MTANHTTVYDFFEHFYNGFNLDRWLSWPPDVFAITSLLLKRTGAYICSVLPPAGAWPDDENWQENLKAAKREWLKWTLGKGDLPDFIIKNKTRLENNWKKVTLNDLSQLTTTNKHNPQDSWELCQSILEFHALADEASAGFGLPLAEEPWGINRNQIILQSIGNIFLAHTGSLSRLPTHIIRILPKFRTPGVGMTLRSLSNNLSAHETEVETNWRSMPWVNIDENTLNILIIPWPFEIEPTWFSQNSYTTQRNSFESTRYFKYENKAGDFHTKKLLELLKNAEKLVGRVHLIVFPELALSEKNYQDILDETATEIKRDRVPMILAGINQPNNELGRNTVVLSTFFAGKWYKMEQDKHHRWKLDKRQLQQYNLGGVLAGNRDWWESIQIPRRHLSILAPNNWLSLCHLVCEDLARQEPIAEIIRGIGPTLLIALLLDGPQLKNRWPGRYASVFADDPGSSVLTISSLGFTKRSLDADGKADSRIIALWKDQVVGWKEIKIDDEKEGVILTVTADWIEEFTADGRGDGNTAAVFALQGVHQIDATISSDQKNKDNSSNQETNPIYRNSEPFDLLEVTLFSYFSDAILDAESDIVELMKAWITGDENHDKNKLDMNKMRFKKDLFEKIQNNIETKKLFSSKDRQYNETVLPFVKWLGDFIQQFANEKNKDTYYEKLVKVTAGILTSISRMPDFTEKTIKKHSFKDINKEFDIHIPKIDDETSGSQKIRIYIYDSLALLWAIHSRLNDKRRNGKLNKDGALLLSKIENLLKNNYDEYWYKAIKAEVANKKKTSGF